jgi:hypothetical protein
MPIGKNMGGILVEISERQENSEKRPRTARLIVAAGIGSTHMPYSEQEQATLRRLGDTLRALRKQKACRRKPSPSKPASTAPTSAR